MSSLSTPSFLHKGISRLKAEQLLLATKEDGSFLVRDSESVAGAYTLCILFQNRVYQYRILTDSDGKLSIQCRETDTSERRRYVDLIQLIHEYKQRGETNSLVCALQNPVDDFKEELEPDSEDEEIQSHRRESAPQDDSVSQQFQKRFAQLDLSCFDGEFVDQLKNYVQHGLAQDVEKTSSNPTRLPHMHKLLTHAARDFNKEMGVFLRKVDLCRQLFSISSSTPSATKLLHEKEENQLDMDVFFERLSHCKHVVEAVEEKAVQTIKNFASSRDQDEVFDNSISFRPFVSRFSSKHKAVIAPTSFEVKLIGKHGKVTNINVTVDVHVGKLFAIRPNKEVLDYTNTFHHGKVLQLIKNTTNNTRLEIIVEGRKKECYQFQDVREREHFCQLVQRMKNIHSVSEETDHISLFIGSFNMGDSSLPSDVTDWLVSQGSGKCRPDNLSFIPHDLYAIGTQESAGSERDWTGKMKAAVFDATNIEYHVVSVCCLWGMRMIILVKPEHKNNISHIQQGTVKTGIANALGNKGGIGVSFYFTGTSFCFVNCHLTSGSEKNNRRNNNFHDIMSALSSSLGRKPLSSLTDLTGQFHHVFWFGDLNYRVEAECQEILQKVNEKKYDYLLKLDQLEKSKTAQEAFLGFQEERIMFPPSYRYTRGSDVYDWRKVKKTGVRINVPSWCDRVLWKSFPHTYVVNTSYGTADSIKNSDHRPVFATFDLGIMTQSHGLTSPSNKDVKIIFERVEAELKTTSKLVFKCEFHSTCLECPVQSKTSQNYSNKALQQENYICPEWTADLIPQMSPIYTDTDYIEEQHILIAVKAVDSDESYGECILALKSKSSIAAQPFSCVLMHNGELTGRIRGMMHVSSDSETVKKSTRSRKSYELITIDTDPHAYSNVSLYDEVDLTGEASSATGRERPPPPLPKVVEDVRNIDATTKGVSVRNSLPPSPGYFPPLPLRSTSMMERSTSEGHYDTACQYEAVGPNVNSADTKNEERSSDMLSPLQVDSLMEEMPHNNPLYSSLPIDEQAGASLGDVKFKTEAKPKPTPRFGVSVLPGTDNKPQVRSPESPHNRRPRMGQSALKHPTVLPVTHPPSSPVNVLNVPGTSQPQDGIHAVPGNRSSVQPMSMKPSSDGNAFVETKEKSLSPPPLPLKRKSCPEEHHEKVYDILKKPSSVNEWLLDIGLPCYIGAFLDNGWDSFEFMGEITPDDLMDIGVALTEHRDRILSSLCDLGMRVKE